MRAIVAMAVLSLIGLAACTPAAPATPAATPFDPDAFVTALPDSEPTLTPLPTATAGALPGRLAVSRQGQPLAIVDLATRAERVLLAPPDGAQFGAVAWSPDGRELAVVQGSTVPGEPLAGSDLVAVDGASGAARLLLARDLPGARLDDPAWSPDGRSLYFGYGAVEYDEGGRVRSSTVEVRALDLAGAAVRTVVPGAARPAVSPDGTQLAYLYTDPQTLATGLWIAAADGSGARELVAGGLFQEIFSVQFAPDGRAIIFTASRAAGASAPPPGGPGWDWLARLDGLLGLRAAEAHGVPADLWQVAPAGGEPVRLTELAEDEPHSAPAPQGGWIALLGARGLYVLDATGEHIARVSEHGGHGFLSWGR